MRWTIAILAVLLLSAGCLGSSEPEDPGQAEDGIDEPPRFEAPTNVSTERPGAEPVVDVASGGTIFVQGIGSNDNDESVNNVWRSTDEGDSWTRLDLPRPVHRYSGDAFVAVGPDDTLYVANAFGPDAPPGQGPLNPVVFGPNTLQVYRSEDLGDTWTRLDPPQLPENVHRMWLHPVEDGTLHLLAATTGSPGSTIAGSAPGPQPLYYARSGDRGETWSDPVKVHPNRSLGSDLAIGPDGRLYTAILLSDPLRWTLASSEDGSNWTLREAFELQGKLRSVWHSLDIDESGHLYLAWGATRNETAHAFLATSADQGRTWSSPTQIGDPNGTQMLPWMTVRAPGVIEALYYATTDEVNPIQEEAAWYAEQATVRNATTPDPEIHRTRLTSWTVHEGTICTLGSTCFQFDSDRRLLDYTWITGGPQGRMHAAFASTQWDSDDSAFPVHGLSLPRGST